MSHALPSSVMGTIARLRALILVVGITYAACVAGGVVTGRLTPKSKAALTEQDTRSGQAVEKVFGRYREAVRQGELRAMAVCSGLVFVTNLTADFVEFTLLSILLAPAFLTLGLGGWMQGVSLSGLHASSGLSLVLFLFMVGLEYVTYVLATVAGINIGLSTLMPKRQGADTRWLAFKRAWAEAGRLYPLIAGVLMVQAVFEMLYVRKVLLMGGTGVPLMPY